MVASHAEAVALGERLDFIGIAATRQKLRELKPSLIRTISLSDINAAGATALAASPETSDWEAF